MADPLTLSAMGAVGITEGIKFLYGQVGEFLKRRRERAAQGEQADTEPVRVQLPAALGGGALDADANLSVVERNQARLAELRSRLANIVDDAVEVDVHDEALLRDVSEFRDLVEQIVGKHLTFTAEVDRPPTGTPVVVGRVRVGQMRASEATGLDVEEMTAGSARGEVDVDVAESGSKVTGGRFGRVGPAQPRKD